jgi:DNA-binding transcriptional ArsR family regulator
VPIEAGAPICRAVSPSAPSELAWILNLLTQTARYAEPALAELDASLLPGIGRLRTPVTERVRRLWRDDHPGCTELLLCADLAGSLLEDDPGKLFAWLERGAVGSGRNSELRTENVRDRAIIGARLDRLRTGASVRSAYLEVLRDVWAAAAPEWDRRGRKIATEACIGWRARLDTGTPIEDLVPPRHPLTRADQLGLDDLFLLRGEFALSPVYFCMSGGHVVDLGEYVHVAVPASDLLPIRRVRDAAFVADRLRVLAEPTRVRILLHVLSTPAGVMELARSMRVSQPTVSGHLKVLREAGLVQPQRFGGRSVFVASRKRVERLIEDARATIARWD